MDPSLDALNHLGFDVDSNYLPARPNTASSLQGVAAIARAQTALSEYQGVPASQEALKILVKSYDQLGMHDLRDDTQRVLETNFPGPSKESPLLKSQNPWWKLW